MKFLLVVLFLLISAIWIPDIDAKKKNSTCVAKKCKDDCIIISYYDSECRPKSGCNCCWTDEKNKRHCTKY